MSFLVDYNSPLPPLPLRDALSIAIVGASTGVFIYFPFLKGAMNSKMTNTPYKASMAKLVHEAAQKPLRTIYGRLPWSMIREAQWITKYPTINWLNQKLEPHMSNSHLRLLFATTLVSAQELACYGVGDFLYTSHEFDKANNWNLSTKDHLGRAFRSRRMGAIPYMATNTIWQFLTMDGISMFQQSLFGRVKIPVSKEVLLPVSIFFPTLLATIAMVPFNAVKTIAQTSSKKRVLGTIEAVKLLNFRGIYRGTWPTIFFAAAKISTGLTIAIFLGEKRCKKIRKECHCE